MQVRSGRRPVAKYTSRQQLMMFCWPRTLNPKLQTMDPSDFDSSYKKKNSTHENGSDHSSNTNSNDGVLACYSVSSCRLDALLQFVLSSGYLFPS